jgi:hypothetical protein
MSSIKHLLRIILINVIIFITLIVLIEFSCNIYRKYSDKAIKEEFSSLLNNPCFVDFFGGEADKQREIIMESALNPISQDADGYYLDDYTGKYQNVENGMRKTCYKNSDPNKRKIYFYGGSTMEGVGVSDCNTIPSYFQKEHPEFEVHNLGVRANLLAFEEAKLRMGDAPPEGSVIIFLDGLNENYWNDADLDKRIASIRNKDKSQFDRLKDFLRKTGTLWVLKEISKKNNINEHDIKKSVCRPALSSEINVTIKIDTSSHRIAARYLESVDKISEFCRIKSLNCLFFLQPIPSYKYSQDLYFYNTAGGFSNRQMEYENFIEPLSRNPSIIDLSNILEKIPKAYVDKVHYSAEANAIIAEAIYNNLHKSRYLADR